MAVLTTEIAQQLVDQSVDVIIPSNYTSIEESAFVDTEIRSVVIPGSVTMIGSGAFASCNLISADIGDGVTEIGLGAFYGNDITDLNIGTTFIVEIPKTN